MDESFEIHQRIAEYREQWFEYPEGIREEALTRAGYDDVFRYVGESGPTLFFTPEDNLYLWKDICSIAAHIEREENYVE